MPGTKIPVLEVERLSLTEDGRGFVAYSDGVNFAITSSSPWTGVLISSTTAVTTRQFLPTASSMGWLKVHYVSSSTYGPTGATGYIPVFRNLNTNTA